MKRAGIHLCLRNILDSNVALLCTFRSRFTRLLLLSHRPRLTWLLVLNWLVLSEVSAFDKCWAASGAVKSRAGSTLCSSSASILSTRVLHSTVCCAPRSSHAGQCGVLPSLSRIVLLMYSELLQGSVTMMDFLDSHVTLYTPMMQTVLSSDVLMMLRRKLCRAQPSRSCAHHSRWFFPATAHLMVSGT